jgi:hypothetical protein
MSEASSRELLAESLIARNRALEQELVEFQTITRENERMEDSIRFLRGLLNNYVELDERSTQFNETLTKALSECAEGVVVWIYVVAVLSFTIAAHALAFYDPGDGLMTLTVRLVLRVCLCAYGIRKLPNLRSLTMGLVVQSREYVDESLKIKRSNHLFPEYFNN